MSDGEAVKDDDIPTGLPDEDVDEAQPLGPAETDPDAEAPPPDDLPGIPEPGQEPPSDG
jgi:hypothetical protein